AYLAFQQRVGMATTFVAYNNPVSAISDLSEGRIHIAVMPLALVLGAVQADKIKLLAVTNAVRTPAAPNVPTVGEAVNVIENALVEHELVIFRNQEITSDNLIDFGRRFGELTVHPFAPHDEKAPLLIKFRNDETNPPFATDVWHSDETFRAEPPMATILCAKLVPAIGGDTLFASMSAAFDGLSGRMQQFISGLEAIHDWKPFKRLF